MPRMSENEGPAAVDPRENASLLEEATDDSKRELQRQQAIVNFVKGWFMENHPEVILDDGQIENLQVRPSVGGDAFVAITTRDNLVKVKVAPFGDAYEVVDESVDIYSFKENKELETDIGVRSVSAALEWLAKHRSKIDLRTATFHFKRHSENNFVVIIQTETHTANILLFTAEERVHVIRGYVEEIAES